MSGRWVWVLFYIKSIPRRSCEFLQDILQPDPESHLRQALADLASSTPDISAWNIPSLGDPSYLSQPLPYEVTSVVVSPWTLADPPGWVCIQSKHICGHHSWRLRRLFRRVAKRLDMHARHIHHTVVPSVKTRSAQNTPVSSVSTVDLFLHQFNPAIAGLQLLTMERLNRSRLSTTLSRRKVSVCLRSCHPNMISTALGDFVFPAVIEAALNSIEVGASIPLIVDSGASCCISPCREDFGNDYAASDVKITDLSSTNRVQGQGTITWRVLDRYGKEVTLTIPGYHVPSASVRLLSPQRLLTVDSLRGGTATQDATKYTFRLANGMVLDAPYGRANLPVLPLSPQRESSLSLWARCFAFSSSDNSAWSKTLLDSKNMNLTSSQKELLLWHQRLSHTGLTTVHNLMRARKSPSVRKTDDLLPLRQGVLLPCKFPPPSSVAQCLLCAACEISKATRRRPDTGSRLASDYSSLKAGHVSPGDCVSCDHYISPTPGRTISHSGHSTTRNGYVGGTIWVDHASKWIFHQPQHSLTSSDTVRGKLLLEREAADVNVKIKSIHTDNGVFNSKEFREHCSSLNQKLSFSGVGAHHQNGVAENAICTISNMARANMIHASLRWPERSLLDLWPFAMSYAIWVHNRLPPHGHGLSPDELWSSTKSTHSDLSRAHVFGCPVYVLEPALQDGKKIPKWDSRARQGIFVGFSSEHSSLVPLIFNPRTQRISPQYHVIFDDAFTTVPSLYSADERNQRFEALFHSSRKCYLDQTEIADIRSPRGDDWSSHGPAASSPPPTQPEGSMPRFDPESLIPPRSTTTTPPAPEGVIPMTDSTAPEDTHQQNPSPTTSPPVSPSPSSRYPSRVRSGTWKDGPARDRTHPATRGQWITGFLGCLLTVPEFAFSAAHTWSQPPPCVTNVGSSDGPIYSSLRVKKSHLASLSLLQDDWTDLGNVVSSGVSQEFAAYLQPDLSDDPICMTITDVQPHILKAKSDKSDPDNPSWSQAMNSSDADKWWEAMSTEMETLEVDLKAWRLVEREPWMKVLPCTWAFRIKRFPDGLVKKFKARFCVRVLWKSRLQTEIALSTMEAEYVALSTACKDLFPLVDLISELSKAVGLDVSAVANMHIKVHEDNVGALTLAGLEPRRMTPRSKHYAIKYHWFREHVQARRVHLLKIDSRNQLGDMFTKGLSAPAFSHLRSLVMGW
eukprot:CCRYP_017868-RA/>CCRYP_017868-RA protein AED:0.22 eAED:0.06 QI:0/0/0/1/1/1/2/0/1188